MFRVVHADARTFDDGDFFSGFGLRDEKIVAQQIVRIQAAVNVHRAAQQSRPLRAAGEIFHRFDGAEQNGGRMAFAFRHDIHAMMDAINQIYVSVAGRAEHDFGPFRPAFR